ncbi:DNA polymerase alpha catalytic subunit [Lodderomyces elongisporus NRRL YB-4239]|uniref:DNA polymerase n=1 Tax=Lodderomyces elongisporus (strain ATCC 11503 / CBS 2605 / JCM 1781 / NBRC 1676 / NRRL YB-4239) TaxID=379508 RepID=A5DZ55_LODEL|nr:DNA polymerase alpha catalytic subunit [Lodderomyces elongisporus NRRL YB-4239]
MLSRAARRDKLKQLQEARKSRGNVVIDLDDDGDDGVNLNKIYDEVDEETFREHKRKQLMDDDFIVDDNGEGYVDNGADEWDDASRPNYYSDEDSDTEVRTSSKKRKNRHHNQRAVKVAKTAPISNFFKHSNDINGGIKKKVDTNIDDILEDFQETKPLRKINGPSAFASTSASAPKFLQENNSRSNNNNNNNNNGIGKIKKKTNNRSFAFSTVSKEKKRPTRVDTFNASSDYTMDFDDFDQQSSPRKEEKERKINVKHEQVNILSSPTKNSLTATGSTLETTNASTTVDTTDKPGAANSVVKASESDSDDDVIVTKRHRAVVSARRQNEATVSSVKPSTTILSSPSHPLGSASSSSSSSSSSQTNHTEKIAQANVDDEQGHFRMFWMDYAEVENSLLLFGKVATRDGKLVSGVVQVNGLCRELFILPREYRMVDGEEDTGSPRVTPNDVREEITPLFMEHYKLETLRAKAETKKYAFELANIPKEAEYLKVLLPYNNATNRKVLPANTEGQTFRHVFGSNTNMFESFVTQRNIMGPCWLDIEGGNFEAIQNSTHCQVEVAVSLPNKILPVDKAPPAAPNLTCTSISVQTVMNPKHNKQEVVSVTLATFFDLPQDAPIPEGLNPNDVITFVRPVGSVSFPPGLNQLAQKEKFNLRLCPNEKVLLNAVAAKVKMLDPDVFVGHRMENISLDVLVHRMYDNQVMTWSALGRRNRKQWPQHITKNKNSSGFNNNLLIREVFQGRLMCDIANEMGQSLTSKCQSWDLAEMYEVVCHKKHEPMDISFQNSKFAEDATLLFLALKENNFNAKITSEIAFSIQILSLSKQLTNIAGNAWSHTLSGTRAGRNEYILLHEFRKNNYIVPDKEDALHKNTSYLQQAKLESFDDDVQTATSNKKPKFQGGLVFEPEKGLHKNYILVMDFNSLYPSIIQEFNICFTTVDRDRFNNTHDEERDLPTLPDNDADAGVLPRLLNTLVTRRREVKKLLKDPKNTPFQNAQYDIKQQALKLTANSMYGCLGYVNSRFYAKPLAMLVTNKGREILMDTRQLAESNSLRVVYGDTDSVMIDTGADNLRDAVKVGEQFKVQVNERYRLLEIDIDNVFRRLLLHAKKKYAAMNASINKATGEEVTTLEVKGLDMRRREYCQLSKEISTFVLMKILSNADPEEALMDVYQYLEEMRDKIIANQVPAIKYKINTKLSKDPTSYPNGKNMPQVQVALKLKNQGKVIKAGSVITYVITAPTAENDTSSVADRARAIQDLLVQKTELRPDPTYYLEKQIFAPVERLLEKIDSVDMVRVATALGIDTKRYILKVKNGDLNGEIMPMESRISDAERFRQSSFLVLKCKCGHHFRFGGIQASVDYRVTFNGVQCSKCEYTFPLIKLTAQLECTIRKHISVYYAGWLVCDDPSCGITTRQISVYGKRCIGLSGKGLDCKGVMSYRYTDKALYNQLLYFQSIFDVEKTKQRKLRPIRDALEEEGKEGKDGKVAELATGQIEALAEQNRDVFAYCQGVVQKYLAECGRRYVNMGSIFDFMSI